MTSNLNAHTHRQMCAILSLLAQDVLLCRKFCRSSIYGNLSASSFYESMLFSLSEQGVGQNTNEMNLVKELLFLSNLVESLAIHGSDDLYVLVELDSFDEAYILAGEKIANIIKYSNRISDRYLSSIT